MRLWFLVLAFVPGEERTQIDHLSGAGRRRSFLVRSPGLAVEGCGSFLPSNQAGANPWQEETSASLPAANGLLSLSIAQQHQLYSTDHGSSHHPPRSRHPPAPQPHSRIHLHAHPRVEPRIPTLLLRQRHAKHIAPLDGRRVWPPSRPRLPVGGTGDGAETR